MSGLIAEGFTDWRECRADFDDHLVLQYTLAERDTNGRLLNDEGRRAGVDAMSLFFGPQVRAFKYASEELREWWEAHPRVTFEAFEHRWKRDRDEERMAS